jgi:predicted nucleic acid-binding protein
MGKRVYIETSVISYLVARPSRNIMTEAWQLATKHWWDNRRSFFDLFASELVLAEASQGDPEAARRRKEQLKNIPDLEVTDSAVALAKNLVGQHALPKEALDDAMHLAVAAVHGIDYLLTWNCRHLDNAEMKPLMRSVCAVAGYRCPEICTPQELMGGQDDD